MNAKTQKIKRGLCILLMLMILLLAFPAPASAQSIDDGDQVVLGGRFRLRSDETLNGNLIIVGGAAILEEGSQVRGDVLVTGGSLEAAGTIDGNITAFGGSVKLMDEVVVNGDVILNSASFSRAPGAVVQGDILNNVISLDGFDFGNLPSITVAEPDYTQPYRVWIDFLTGAIWWVLRILAISGLGALVVLIAQKPTERVAKSIGAQPIIASAFGLLTAVVAPALLLLLTVTIILIPVGLIGILILVIAGLYGWVAVGYEIGRRLEKALKTTWAPAIAGGIGTFVLTITMSVFGLVPCIGWLVPVIVSIIGIGGVLISRFGTQVYGLNGSAGKGIVVNAEVEKTSLTEKYDEEDKPYSQSPTE